MEILTFIFYFLIACIGITQIPFFKKSALGSAKLIILFTIKIFAGIAYAQFYSLPKYYEGSDTWRFYRISLIEKQWLLTDPKGFFTDIFLYGYQRPGSLFSGENSYWNDLKSNLPIKILAISNVLTNNNYYADIIIFNLLFIIGLVALYRFFIHYFPENKWAIIAGIFLLPSTLFWCSGIHKDGLILSALGCLIYCLDKKSLYWRHYLIITICIVLVFALRNFVLFAWLPAAACWQLSKKFPRYSSVIFISISLACLATFFAIPAMIPSIDPPLILSAKQSEFLQLKGGSAIITQPLLPTLSGFIHYFPSALDAAFLRPHFNEFHNLSYLPAIAENLFFYCLFIAFLLTQKTHRNILNTLYFFLFFTISFLLICGYTITLTGAMVRYKSLILPFIITPLLCLSNINFSRKLFKRTE